MMAGMSSTQELLDAVEAAIKAQLTGKIAEWTEAGHQVRLLPLATLMKMRTELRDQLASETGPSILPITEVDL